MIEYSHPTLGDVPAIVEVWNAAFGPAFPLTERLLLQTVQGDPYYEAEGCWVARRDGSVVGWVLSKSMQSAGPEFGRFEGRGGIGGLCVHPDCQEQGIGRELLFKAEEFLRESGSPVTTLYYPHHLLPGVPDECENMRAMFNRRKYTHWRECVDMWRELHDFELPEKVLRAMEANPAVEIRPAHEHESTQLTEWMAAEFPGGWTYSTRSHFERGGAASDILVAVEHGEIIGFCHTADWNSQWLIPSTYWFPLLGEKYGGLGPVGLGKEQRKRGLGLALTALSVQDLKDRGVQRMAIDWTNLISFYEQLDFTVWKRYWQGERN